MRTSNWMVSDSIAKEFSAACRDAAADSRSFAAFRSHAMIVHVIENKPNDWKSILVSHVEQLADNPQSFLQAAANNDRHGLWPPRKDPPCATSVWYARDSVILSKLFDFSRPLNIIEVGGGYGGLAAVV